MSAARVQADDGREALDGMVPAQHPGKLRPWVPPGASQVRTFR